MQITQRGTPPHRVGTLKLLCVNGPLAEQGVANAQYNLGVMYDNGDGVPQDSKTAEKWYTLAAEQGDAKSQYNLV